MSFVTLGDKAKVLALIDPRFYSRRTKLLISLLCCATWTDRQRALVDRLWREQAQTNKEAHHE